MKLITHSLLLILFLVGISNTSIAQKANTARTKPKRVTLEEITYAITNGFGSKMRVVTDTQPFYLLGDFNGDGYSDLAVLVNPEEAKAELKQHGVRYVDVDPSSSNNGKESDPESATFQYCLGIALMHGGEREWSTPPPEGKYLFYECFIPFRLVPKATIIHRYRGGRKRPPRLRGDGIYLYLERDAGSIVYWTGTTYRGYYQ